MLRRDFVKFLRSRVTGHRDKVTKATGDDRLRVLYNLLKDKVLRIRSGVPWVVASGAAVTVTDPDKKVEQPGIVLDDKTLDMAVKTAVNKSGNVPTGTESSRQLLTVTDLKEVVTEVMATQQQSVPKATKDKMAEMTKLVSQFDVKKATTITENVDHLAAVKKAFVEFEELGKSNLEVVKVEVDAAAKLLKQFVLATDGEDKLPPFVLAQLRELLEDATKNQARIVDFVRNIQGIHEIVILALEWNNVPIDAKYD